MTDVVEVAPSDARLAPLISAHLTFAHATSPACSVHSLDAAGLSSAEAQLFAIFSEDGAPLAMGALARLDRDHGEVKSMHVAEAARGKGLARAILERLLAEARVSGLTRVSLETGTQEPFAPARALYAKTGFTPCAPFAQYTNDPMSAYYTRTL
ncbi:MAG: GNAT family N-acetyltransferase [Pseudomonadota bacterium]